MKVAIIGSRTLDSDIFIDKIVDVLPNKTSEIISGGCPKGGDRFAEIISDSLDIKKTIFKADWKQFGRSAGVIRNKDIIQNCDLVIAVWDRKSKGTQSSIKLAEKFKKQIIIIDS